MLELRLLPTQISAEDLVEIYKAFCTSYDIPFTARDKRFIRTQGSERLRSHFGLDYRPFMGAKFFGQRVGDSTQFWGYTDIEDLDMTKDKKFQELALQYLKNKK